MVQGLGLALFVYTVGLASGAAFFSSLRRQLPLMLCAVVVLAIAAATMVAVGTVFGLSSALQGGAFAGALTSTPTLAAATAKAGTDEPAIGYALTYPVGVVLTIVAVSAILNRRWSSPKDPPPISGQQLVDFTVEVRRPVQMRDVPGFTENLVRFSYLCRQWPDPGGAPWRDVPAGDRVVIIAPGEPAEAATSFLGERVTRASGPRPIDRRLPAHPDLQSGDRRPHHR